MQDEKLLEVEEKVSNAMLALEKATATFETIFNDLEMGSDDVTSVAMYWFKNRRQSISNRCYIVTDYLANAYEQLEGVTI